MIIVKGRMRRKPSHGAYRPRVGRIGVALTMTFGGLASAAAMASSPAGAQLSATAVAISGTGSSFAAPAVLSWVHAVATPPYSIPISYGSTNSGQGRYEFTNGTTDYAVSDIGYVGNTDTTPPSFKFNFIPITAGGIAFMYDVPGLSKQLQLSSYSACGLLTGGIKNWNSPTIAADNPGVSLPNVPVIPVTESDSAGTNYVLEEWCIDEQPALWKAFVQAQEAQNGGVTDGVALSPTSPNSNWPGVQGGLDDQSTTAVAGDVQTHGGAIGAVQVKYATDDGFTGSNPAKAVALVKNASGDYTAPNPVDVASALAYATQLPDGTHVLDFNGAGPHVYNPSTYSYLLTPTTGWDPGKGETMSEFVNYVLTLGQQAAPSFGYASLGLSLEQYGINAVKNNVPGAVALTASEQNGYACGDLTQADAAAGITTPSCGVLNPTAAPATASSGTATGPPATQSSTASSQATTTTPTTGSSHSSTTTGGTSSTSKSGTSTSGAGSTTATSGSSLSTLGSTASGSTASGSTGAGATNGSGADPSVSLTGAPTMANTGGNPIPLTIAGVSLILLGDLGRRRFRRRSGVTT